MKVLVEVEVLTVVEMASRVNVSRAWFYKLLNSERLPAPAKKIGNRYFYGESDVTNVQDAVDHLERKKARSK